MGWKSGESFSGNWINDLLRRPAVIGLHERNGDIRYGGRSAGFLTALLEQDLGGTKLLHARGLIFYFRRRRVVGLLQDAVNAMLLAQALRFDKFFLALFIASNPIADDRVIDFQFFGNDGKKFPVAQPEDDGLPKLWIGVEFRERG